MKNRRKLPKSYIHLMLKIKGIFKKVPRMTNYKDEIVKLRANLIIIILTFILMNIYILFMNFFFKIFYRNVPLILFIILPFIMRYFFEEYFPNLFKVYLGDIVPIEHYLFKTIPFSFNIIDIFIILPIFIYLLLPCIYDSKKYILKRGFKYAICEFEFIKKIIWVEIPLFIIYIIILYFVIEDLYIYLFNFSNSEATFIDHMRFDIYQLFLNMDTYLLYPFIASIIWIAIQTIKKDYLFYLSYAYIKIMLEEKDDLEKLKYFIKGLSTYNNYLRKNIKFEINDIRKVYSLLSITSLNQKELITSISNAFESNNKLTPISFISKNFNIKAEELLIKISLKERVKEASIFVIGTIIPVLISIIQLLPRP